MFGKTADDNRVLFGRETHRGWVELDYGNKVLAEAVAALEEVDDEPLLLVQAHLRSAGEDLVHRGEALIDGLG